MEERLEFKSFDQFLEQAERVKVMYSKDGHLFFDTYEELTNCYGGDILLPKRELLNTRKYYVIKGDN